MFPHKINEKFRQYHFVPYSKLVPDDFNKLESDQQEFIFNASGGLIEKGSDLSREYSLSSLDWMNAANRAVAWTHYWHGNARAIPLQDHHEFVIQIGKSHGWSVALEYDVHQRKIAETDVYHDLSTPNMKMLLLIASKPAHMMLSHQLTALYSPSKRRFVETHTQSERQPKRMKSERFRCFRCGKPGHFPAQCQSDKTVAGKTPFLLSPTAKNENAITAPDGRHLCTRWARSSNCQFGAGCTAAHICSLCGDSNHGSMRCPAI